MEQMIVSQQIIAWMGTILLISGFLTVLFRRFWNILACYRVQSFALAVAMWTTGRMIGNAHIEMIAYATVVVKVILIPAWIRHVLSRVATRTESRLTVGVAFSLFSAAGLLLLSHVVASRALHGLKVAPEDLTEVLALVLIGLFQMMTRREAVTQMLGILFIENAVTLAALTLAKGLPMIIELGIMFDVLIGILAMGILVYRIQEEFDTTDTAHLSTLQG
ncbi:MAG TPA: hypothetical protein PKM25_13760 [Candidatus Ozemobacteraceae bacterium]|nr:hypothetical protein [Candidatus Ozemobacteraceae bacterium]